MTRGSGNVIIGLGTVTSPLTTAFTPIKPLFRSLNPKTRGGGGFKAEGEGWSALPGVRTCEPLVGQGGRILHVLGPGMHKKARAPEAPPEAVRQAVGGGC